MLNGLKRKGETSFLFYLFSLGLLNFLFWRLFHYKGYFFLCLFYIYIFIAFPALQLMCGVCVCVFVSWLKDTQKTCMYCILNLIRFRNGSFVALVFLKFFFFFSKRHVSFYMSINYFKFKTRKIDHSDSVPRYFFLLQLNKLNFLKTKKIITLLWLWCI